MESELPEKIDNWTKAFVLKVEEEDETLSGFAAYSCTESFDFVIDEVPVKLPVYKFKINRLPSTDLEEAVKNFNDEEVWFEMFLTIVDLSPKEIVSLYTKAEMFFPDELRGDTFDETLAVLTMKLISLMVERINNNAEEDLPPGNGSLFGGTPPGFTFPSNLN